MEAVRSRNRPYDSGRLQLANASRWTAPPLLTNPSNTASRWLWTAPVAHLALFDVANRRVLGGGSPLGCDSYFVPLGCIQRATLRAKSRHVGSCSAAASCHNFR